MATSDGAVPRYYFALPRLISRLRGGSSMRTENNWREANLAGGAVFLVSYAAVGRLLLRDATVTEELLLGLPIGIATWLFWLVALYVNSLEIRLLRACGLMRQLSDARAQSILIGLTTTVFACWLAAARSAAFLLALAWLCAATLNLTAAAILRLLDAPE
jgi:hypothetical protein